MDGKIKFIGLIDKSWCKYHDHQWCEYGECQRGSYQDGQQDIEQVGGHVPRFPVTPFIAYLGKNWDESGSDRSFGKDFPLNVRNAESDEKRICCRSCAELHGDNQVSKESK